MFSTGDDFYFTLRALAHMACAQCHIMATGTTVDSTSQLTYNV